MPGFHCSSFLFISVWSLGQHLPHSSGRHDSSNKHHIRVFSFPHSIPFVSLFSPDSTYTRELGYASSIFLHAHRRLDYAKREPEFEDQIEKSRSQIPSKRVRSTAQTTA